MKCRKEDGPSNKNKVSSYKMYARRVDFPACSEEHLHIPKKRRTMAAGKWIRKPRRPPNRPNGIGNSDKEFNRAIRALSRVARPERVRIQK